MTRAALPRPLLPLVHHSLSVVGVDQECEEHHDDDAGHRKSDDQDVYRAFFHRPSVTTSARYFPNCVGCFSRQLVRIFCAHWIGISSVSWGPNLTYTLPFPLPFCPLISSI